MIRPLAKVTALLCALTSIGLGRSGAMLAAQGPTSSTVPAPERALLNQYCVTCHNERLPTANLELDHADIANVGADAALWERVIRKLNIGAMPPIGRPRPDKATTEAFVAWLEARLDDSAAARPNVGRTEAFHRLNRTEYANAVRDLLAIDVHVASLLPPDDASYGFDNSAGVLGISPVLLERYLGAASRISRDAVGASEIPPGSQTFQIRSDLPQNDRLEGLPFGTRGGTTVRYNFPLDGQYDIKVRLGRNAQGDLAVFADRHELEISIDGERVRTFTVGGEQPPPEKRGQEDLYLQLRVPVKAGPRDVTATFVKKTSALDETQRLPFLRPYTGIQGDTRSQPYIGQVMIAGPFDAHKAENTPSRQRIFTCRPSVPQDQARCARRIAANLANHAFRRPATAPELARLQRFYREGREEGFEAGIEMVVRGILTSPEFLFRMELDPPGVPPGAPYRVRDVELASRLSFFLWSSIPDAELLRLAERGELGKQLVLRRQIDRMLADPRSGQLVKNFAGQWLWLRNVPATTPDLTQFPDYDESLRQAFVHETELFFESVLRENRSVLDLLRADYTFVNERLAEHYGIPNVLGPEFRRVALPQGSPRGGLLGQGSILTVTAYSTRNSPVIRGKWILENLLGYTPPAPPANVPPLSDTNETGKVLSMRERMAQHRSNAACASCHAVMDPPGLSLENFDAVGKWRTRSEAGTPIDASGMLPDGTVFEGVAGLRTALLSRPRQVVGTVTEKLLTYALGRGLEYSDMPDVRKIVRDIEPGQYGLKDLVVAIVESPLFQMRQAPVPASVPQAHAGDGRRQIQSGDAR